MIRVVVTAALLASGVLETGRLRAAEEAPPPLPPFSRIERSVLRTLAARGNPLPLGRDDVAAVLSDLKRQGWRIEESKAIEERFLPPTHPLVRELRSRNGRKFAGQVARYPQAFDRLERLTRMPYGERRIRELVRGPDGYRLVKYMTVSPYARNIGRQLSRGKNGRGFNKPTSHLYTPENLLSTLREAYQAESKRRQGERTPRRDPGDAERPR